MSEEEVSVCCLVCENKQCAVQTEIFEAANVQYRDDLLKKVQNAARWSDMNLLLSLYDDELLTANDFDTDNKDDIRRLQLHYYYHPRHDDHFTVRELLECESKCKPTHVYWISVDNYSRKIVEGLLDEIFPKVLRTQIFMPYMGGFYELEYDKWDVNTCGQEFICSATKCLWQFLDSRPTANFRICKA